MKRMKNVDVICEFVNGGQNVSNHSQSLYIDDDKLYNYSTVIAQWTPYGLTINDTKYSVTTSKLQNYVKREAYCKYHIVSNVPIGTWNLTLYVEKKLGDIVEKCDLDLYI